MLSGRSGSGPTYSTIQGIPRECSEIYDNGTRTSGLYLISPDGRYPFYVYCNLTNGGWTVIQNREDGGTNFYRNWTTYAKGFGSLDGEYWLGLEKIHRLTRDTSEIYFYIENYDGTFDYAHYMYFTVHGASTLYTMNVNAYGYDGSIPQLLTTHDNMNFSAYDNDNDLVTGNCARINQGSAWWYSNCGHMGIFNGVYNSKQQGGIAYYVSRLVFVKNVQIAVRSLIGQSGLVLSP